VTGTPPRDLRVLRLLTAKDLLDARVGYARGFCDRALAVAVPDRLTDALPPRLVSFVAADGEASEEGEASFVSHLADGPAVEPVLVHVDDLLGEVAQHESEALVAGVGGFVSGGKQFVRDGHRVDRVSRHTARILASHANVKRAK
jgi:hypothetical protein